MNTRKLVDAEKLRSELFDEDRRPTLGTIHAWRMAGIIPSYKIGHRVWYDLDDVRAHLERRNKIKARA